MILIVGAGVSGLTVARELGGNYLVLEKTGRAGGLASQYRSGPYYFDQGGHYFHFPGGSSLYAHLNQLHPLRRFIRKSRVLIDGTLVPFPVQYHIGFLPPAVRESASREIFDIGAPDCRNLETYLLSSFGPTLYRTFFRPFLAKYYRSELKELSGLFGQRSIPPPRREAVEKGIRKVLSEPVGYNRFFYYPRGEMRAFIKAYAAGTADKIRFNREVVEIDLNRRKVITCDGKFSYSILVNTMPLSRLLSLLARKEAADLRWISTRITNFVLENRLQDFHWVYLPDPGTRFYRAGYYPGHTRIKGYLEETLSPGDRQENRPDRAAVIHALKSAGMIRNKTEVRHLSSRIIPVSYILKDHRWQSTVPPILAELKTSQVYSIGRYGAWRYSSMTDDIRMAAETAREIEGK